MLSEELYDVIPPLLKKRQTSKKRLKLICIPQLDLICKWAFYVLLICVKERHLIYCFVKFTCSCKSFLSTPVSSFT